LAVDEEPTTEDVPSTEEAEFIDTLDQVTPSDVTEAVTESVANPDQLTEEEAKAVPYVYDMLPPEEQL
jgi:hypothetical protein